MESILLNKPIIHIFIIWSNAVEKKDYILDDLGKHFHIYSVFKFHWKSETFLDNYTSFYAHSLRYLSKKQLIKILNNKILHCGKEDFYVIVLEDPSPQMQYRKTSNGNRIVNINVFDKKTEYRILTGGGHRIHSSDDAWETNKDLTLLFGLNTKDFLKRYNSIETEVIPIDRNCTGVGGYDSIQQFFYVLNNAIEYCVLRNHECLPEEYTIEGHGDIDLLVENKNYILYLTLAKPIFRESYRVYHTIMISGLEVPFDFRYVGDNYYDRPWEENILKTRVLQKDSFYTPNTIHQYFTLLYHAYIQKWEVKEDYFPKLTNYAKEINEVFIPEIEPTIKQLDAFMEDNRYEYTIPIDKSVVYNTKNISSSRYAFRYGQLIKRLNGNDPKGNFFHSRVYEKSDSFVKIGTNWLIHNETIFLRRLEKFAKFPKVLSEINDVGHDETILEISRVEGVDFGTFFSNVNHQRRKYIKSFILDCIDLLDKLYSKDIAHRDFIPTNLIISENNKRSQVSLIDFGWATNVVNLNINRPSGLGERYVSQKNATDSYSLGKILLFYWYDLPYVRIVGKLLLDISYDDYLSKKIFQKKLKKISLIAKMAFTPYDDWRLFCRRHIRIGQTKKAFLKNLCCNSVLL